MKKLLSSLLFTSCLIGVHFSAAEAAPLLGGTGNAISTVPLHIRSGPGKHYKSHDILPPDYPFKVGNCTRDWCQVSYNGRSGWSSIRYLAFKEGGEHYNDPKLGFVHSGALGPRRARYHGSSRRTAFASARKAVEYKPGSYDAKAASAVTQAAEKASGFVNAEAKTAAAPAAAAAGSAGAAVQKVNAAATNNAAAAVGNAAVNSGYKAVSAAANAGNKAADMAAGYAKAAVEKTKGYARTAVEYAKSYANRVQIRGGDYGRQAGWWTNYQRPSYQRAWKPRWWQKK